MNEFALLIAATLNAGTVLAIAALGLLINERAGIVNLGTEGIMLVAAVAGYAVAVHSGSDLLAFGAGALITTGRHSPQESGVLAKSASGALETMPWVRVVNLARALEELAEAGYWRIGLAGEAETVLADVMPTGAIALVLGAEGEGLRPNIANHCDVLAKLPITSAIESLNVSNAAAIALYAAATRG